MMKITSPKVLCLNVGKCETKNVINIYFIYIYGVSPFSNQISTLGISLRVSIPKPCGESSGGYIFLPLVFCSSGRGHVSTMLMWYKNAGCPGIGLQSVRESAI